VLLHNSFSITHFYFVGKMRVTLSRTKNQERRETTKYNNGRDSDTRIRPVEIV
jgi:hypothetical protein